MEFNPVLVCKNKNDFDGWARDFPDQFKYAKDLNEREMRRLELNMNGDKYVAYFMGEEEIRGCDYHTSHWLADGTPGIVHVIALAPFANKAEETQGKGRSGRGAKEGKCEVLAISKLDK